MICGVYRLPRSSAYAAPRGATPGPPASKRGPKTRVGDAELVVAIREVLAACSFHGEGYRKVRARLGHRGLAVGGKRVLQLMRAHGLLAPRRLGPRMGIRPMTGPSLPTDQMSCGGPTPRASTLRRTAGAGSSGRSTTGLTRWLVGMPRRSATARPPWNRSGKGSGTLSGPSARIAPEGSSFAATGGRSTPPLLDPRGAMVGHYPVPGVCRGTRA